MKKVIVITGVNGFIGSHMAEKCLKDGYTVIGIDIGSTSVIDKIKYYQLNLYEDSIDDILEIYHPYALIHCAGMADVNYSVQHSDSDFVSNVVIARKVIYSIKNVSRDTMFIFLSSAGVYGNPIKNPISENHEKNPISPYALHKVLVEEICCFFVRQYDMDVRILRIFSAYGAGLKKQIFWDMGQKVKKYGRLELFGTGEETRDFIHIDDLVRVIQMIMEADRTDEIVYNVANGIEISIRSVAEIFCEKSEIGKDLLSFNGCERQGNPINWCADIRRIKTLGYTPKIDISMGITEYVGWLKQTKII